MYSDVSPTTSSSRLALSGRSILSRLTSPLRSRNRNATDFHIRASEPHRQYSPGDIVKGIVVLTVVKPIRITHLTVALHGFVRVLKKPAPAGEVITSDHVVDITSNKRSQYTGNGHVSLFHDEITLCGEGRLEPGIYEFEFNLQFPSQGLPSSIDFERGTISYMIRSTLTRPTSIAATSTCERKISLVETVDIGPMSIPKPRIISLEPIAKNSRKHRSAVKAEQAAAAAESLKSSAQPKTAESAAAEDSASQRPSISNPPSSPTSPLHSDLQSEISEGSVVSSSSTGYVIGHSTQSKPVSSTPDTGSNKPAPNKTITAKIELLKAGCLPGDSIPITISIQHTKRIKSLHGIIITLYRQGRIDSAPPLSLFTDIKGKDLERLKHEEYYPKSKTGLGGLSLTSAGSSSVFRKDLSQTLAPIMIDPATLSTVVTASLRVPEDVFPTITGVPGEMISFRYYVEVVVDLGGKLAGQDRHLPRLGMVSLPSITNPNDPVLGTDRSTAPTLAAWGGNIVDTDRIRREKSVVACLFEIILGTTDSARMRGRGNITKKVPVDDVQTVIPTPAPPLESEVQQNGHAAAIPGEAEYYDEYGQSWTQWPEGSHDQTYTYNDEQQTIPDQNQVPEYSQSTVPAPQISAPENLNEKDRVRFAEQTLLPSQPLDDAGPSAPPQPTPTAPPDPDDDLYNDDYRPTAPPAQLVQQRPSAVPIAGVANSSDTLRPASPQNGDTQSQATESRVDDKRELERRRLQAEASSPSDFPDLDDTAGEGASGSAPQPSAPFLDEEDEYANGHDGLPRYER